MCPPPCGPGRPPGKTRRSDTPYRYAARFKVGCLELTVASNTLCGLVDELWESQDLSCLSRQARLMGSDGDRLAAERLDRFLDRYHCGSLRCRDIRELDLGFSIGRLACLKLVTSREEATALLET